MSGQQQYAVVFFNNGSDQTMTDAVGPFRSHELAEVALAKMTEVIHVGGTPQLVNLHTLAEAVLEFGVPLDQREGPDDAGEGRRP